MFARALGFIGVLIIALSLAGAAHAERTQAPRSLREAIAAFAAKHQGVVPGEPTRQTVARLDGDQLADTLVLFTVEGMGGGGNNWARFLAISASSLRYAPIVTEFPGPLQVERVEVRDGLIVAHGRVARASDPRCCPSIRDSATYRFVPGDLDPVARTGARK